MTLTTAIWRLADGKPKPVRPAGMDLEARLEDLIVADPDLLGPDQLMIIDRQVHTSHGKFLDLLAIDDEATLHAIELKRDRTPRDVVAQALDYGWWVRELTLEDLQAIWDARSIDDDSPDDFEAAYHERFKSPLDLDKLNAAHALTVVAATIDPGSQRIIEYLADDYNVPINAVVFTYFLDEGREYLARTWVRPPAEDETKPAPKRAGRAQKRPWNGRDIFVPLGRRDDGDDGRWHSCLKYGFVGAGGGAPYWKFLRNLEPGLRVFGFVASAGYVAVGEVTGTMVPLAELEVEVAGVPTRAMDLPDIPEELRERALLDDENLTEYAVPVRWLSTVSVDEAIWEAGLFANQLPCRLKHAPTIDAVAEALGLAPARPTGFSQLPVDDQIAAADPTARDLYEQVERTCTAAGLARVGAKHWSNFVADDGRIVLSVVLRKKSLRIYTSIGTEELVALGVQARNVTGVGHHGNGDTEVVIEQTSDLAVLDHLVSG